MYKVDTDNCITREPTQLKKKLSVQDKRQYWGREKLLNTENLTAQQEIWADNISPEPTSIVIQ